MRDRPDLVCESYESRPSGRLFHLVPADKALAGLRELCEHAFVVATVSHLLVARDGSVLRNAAFAPGIVWRPGEIVRLGSGELYNVLERRDGDPVVLVVEPI